MSDCTADSSKAGELCGPSGPQSANRWKVWHMGCQLLAPRPCLLRRQARLPCEGAGQGLDLHPSRWESSLCPQILFHGPLKTQESCRIWVKSQKLARKLKGFYYFRLFHNFSKYGRQYSILPFRVGPGLNAASAVWPWDSFLTTLTPGSPHSYSLTFNTGHLWELNETSYVKYLIQPRNTLSASPKSKKFPQPRAFPNSFVGKTWPDLRPFSLFLILLMWTFMLLCRNTVLIMWSCPRPSGVLYNAWYIHSIHFINSKHSEC